jgi:hypothetical protein
MPAEVGAWIIFLAQPAMQRSGMARRSAAMLRSLMVRERGLNFAHAVLTNTISVCASKSGLKPAAVNTC